MFFVLDWHTLIDYCLNNREALLIFGVNALTVLMLTGSGYVQGDPSNQSTDGRSYCSCLTPGTSQKAENPKS